MGTPTRERILVVDDDAGMRRVFERVLQSLYDIECAGSAGEAMRLLQSGRFQVALVDIQLGDGSGFAVCQEARRVSPETDVILITGSASEPNDKLYRSLEEGAFYFLLKPFDRRVLKALVGRCLDLQRQRRAKEKFAESLAEDLEQARRFQQSLVPAQPLSQSGWRLDGRFEPCDALGGDFYSFALNRNGSVSFALADVVGHGVRAAMYAGMLWSSLDAARRRDPDPGRVLEDLLQGIDFFEGDRYSTLVYGTLSPDGRLRYFNAGHPPLLVLAASDGFRELSATRPILTSALPTEATEPAEVPLAPGDRVVLYTDGIFEALDPKEEEFGRDTFVTSTRELGRLAPTELLDRLLRRVRDHCAGRPLTDDATMLLIDRLSSGKE